ncbi:MAG TPA: hypothetical protein VED24_03180 [Candidatus Acidoferrum sp.]|nr:hypothetical protein [Candidatus Acidoferrum sp.]
MSRTLIIVPRMYTKDEFREEASYVPDDYDMKCEEFWGYVAEKLNVFRGRIRKIFRESLSINTKEDLLALSGDEQRGLAVLSSLLRDGAQLEPTEDPILIAETESWAEMMRRTPNEMLSELYEQSLAERNLYVANRIGESLHVGEVGLLLVDSRRRIELAEDIRVIRACPFDPADFLASTIVKAKLSQQSRT